MIVQWQDGEGRGCQKWNVCELHTASYKSERQVGGGGRGEGRAGGGGGKAGWGERGSQCEGVIGGMTR